MKRSQFGPIPQLATEIRPFASHECSVIRRTGNRVSVRVADSVGPTVPTAHVSRPSITKEIATSS
jgi:hypothetical protein